ncbi:MAG: hypothetical protein ACI8R4_000338 [Paracoccaceae bacterium]|jgi:hypothetical protein
MIQRESKRFQPSHYPENFKFSDPISLKEIDYSHQRNRPLT